MLEPSYPQTDTRQSERQRERQGNVVDLAEQEMERSRETLRQMQMAADVPSTEHDPLSDDLTVDLQHEEYPGAKGWDDWEEFVSEH